MNLSFYEKIINKIHSLLFMTYKYKVRNIINKFYCEYTYEQDYALRANA